MPKCCFDGFLALGRVVADFTIERKRSVESRWKFGFENSILFCCWPCTSRRWSLEVEKLCIECEYAVDVMWITKLRFCLVVEFITIPDKQFNWNVKIMSSSSHRTWRRAVELQVDNRMLCPRLMLFLRISMRCSIITLCCIIVECHVACPVKEISK